jgi:hypothetical protein
MRSGRMREAMGLSDEGGSCRDKLTPQLTPDLTLIRRGQSECKSGSGPS